VNPKSKVRAATKSSASSLAKTAANSRTDLYIAVSIAITVLAAYVQVATHAFISLDDLYYVANQHVLRGLTADGIAWSIKSAQAPDFWFPLTLISHMIDRQFFGDRSGLHHLMSVAIHMASSVLLFLVIKKPTGTRWPSAFVAFAFAIHPLHVESVAWAAERKDVLSGLFWILAIGAYFNYAMKPGAVCYLATLMLVCCALMSKPMTVTLPFVLLLLDRWPLKRATSFRRLVIEKIPLFAGSAAVAALTFIVQRRGGALQSVEQLPVMDRWANALVSYVKYISSFFWPSSLAPFYPFHRIPFWQGAAAGVVLMAITAFVLRAKRQPYLAVGWLWYLGTLIPVIGLIQAGDQARADRFTYLPSIGLSIMVAWGVAALFELRQWSRRALGAVAAGTCVVWFVLTFIQVGYWIDGPTLFRHTLEVTGDNYVAYLNLGVALRQEGRIDDALANFERAVEIKPQFPDAQATLGEALLARGRTTEALPHLLDALRMTPDSPYVRANLGTALNLTGRPKEAEAQYREALRLAPGIAASYEGLGLALMADGRLQEALPELIEAVRLDPGNTRLRSNLARDFTQLNRPDDAIAQLSEALRLQPTDAEAHFTLGNVYAAKNRTAQALNEFAAAARLKPDYVNAHYNAGIALADLGRYDEAAREFAEALRLKPDFEDARRNFEYYSARTARSR
jgi:tetratricopeptide (TPR) repeat protein